MLKHIRLTLLIASLLVLLTACTANTGIFASGTWQSAGLTKQHIHTLAVDPNNPQNIYAGDTQDGVYYSADGGLHWQQRSAGLPTPLAVNALAFNDSGKTLYAATANGLYASTNAGQSWTILPHLPIDNYTAIAFNLKTPGAIFTASLHHGLLYSSNSGLSWTSINAGLPAQVTINALTFDSNSRDLWVATSQGVYFSDDNGASWRGLNTGLPRGAIINDVLPASVQGGNPDLVFAATNQGFFLSQDQGLRWAASQTPLEHVNILDILIDTQTVSTVYIATDKVGVLRSTDSGENWGGTSPGLPADQPVYNIIQGATNYSQLFAAANNVYLYPGTSGAFNPSQILPLLLGILFFYLLYRISRRGLRRSLNMPVPGQPGRPEEKPGPEPEEKQNET
jgi:ligand-binding sensor domain-containing protein